VSEARFSSISFELLEGTFAVVLEVVVVVVVAVGSLSCLRIRLFFFFHQGTSEFFPDLPMYFVLGRFLVHATIS
jgi:hypothetical protein